jgi:GT2 family glycosyltransferase
MNMRESSSWHYSQTDVFEYGLEHILLVDSKKSDVTEDKINMNPDSPENIDTQNFVLALKDHILNEWQKQADYDNLRITFNNNILNIKGEDGFTLSNYDFNEMVINGTEDPQVIYLTVGNEGGGGGGNVMLEETYSLTVLDAENFEINRL